MSGVNGKPLKSQLVARLASDKESVIKIQNIRKKKLYRQLAIIHWCGAITDRVESPIDGCGTSPDPTTDTSGGSEGGEGETNGDGDQPQSPDTQATGFIFPNRFFNLFSKLFR